MAAGARSIRRKILIRFLAIAVLSVIAVGIAGVMTVEFLARDTDRRLSQTHSELTGEIVGDELARSAETILSELQRHVDEQAADAQTRAATPVVQAAAADGSAIAAELGLADLSDDELEALFISSRRLPGAADATTFLVGQVSQSPDVVDVFLTNEFGHNVAVTAPTTDFVQSDEQWWQNAWGHGISIGPVAYHDSAGVLSTSIAVRVDDAVFGAPLGVMTAVIDISIAQEVADRLAIVADGAVSILDGEGRLVAETDSEHPADRILTDGVEPDAEIAGLGALGGDGHVLGAESVYGYASSVTSDSSLDWTVVVEQPNGVAFAPLVGTEELSDELRTSAQRFSALLLLVVLAVLTVAVLGSWLLARGIVRSLDELRGAAEPYLPRLDDDIERADAADQGEIERSDVAQAFVNMGRRDRNLLRRQVAMIDRLRDDEHDRARATALSTLGQLTLRLQRNAENLLVLAAEQTPPDATGSVEIREIFDRAGSVLEEYQRVDLALDPVAVPGAIVADTAHLLAELLENALAFSSRDTFVTVRGQLAIDGYRISVTDHGIGIAGTELATANERLQQPHNFHRSPETRLGLYVVGRLAARHGIDVTLAPAPAGGIVAHVTIPLELSGSSSAGHLDWFDEPAATAGGNGSDGFDLDLVDHAEHAAPPRRVEPVGAGVVTAAPAVDNSIWPEEFSPVDGDTTVPLRSNPIVDRPATERESRAR